MLFALKVDDYIFNIIVGRKEAANFYNFYVVKLYPFTIQQNMCVTQGYDHRVCRKIYLS